MRRHAAEGQFARGSMGPKVDAALRFLDAGGARAVITSLEHIADAVEGDDVGTIITNRPPAA
jgi:carbamate kinase